MKFLATFIKNVYREKKQRRIVASASITFAFETRVHTFDTQKNCPIEKLPRRKFCITKDYIHFIIFSRIWRGALSRERDTFNNQENDCSDVRSIKR